MKPFITAQEHSYRWKFKAVSLIVLCSLFIGCRVTNRIVVKEDIVYSSKRVELKLLHKDTDIRSPLQHVLQSFVKQIDSESETTYKVFDVLTLTNASFKLDDKVFYIIDGKVFQMPIETKEIENSKIISENKEEILAADSTKISVVTGYSENNSKITRFSYRLTDEAVSSLKGANVVVIRYYSGPDMISIKVKNRKLKKVKEMIERK
jgi:hypothetical protein